MTKSTVKSHLQGTVGKHIFYQFQLKIMLYKYSEPHRVKLFPKSSYAMGKDKPQTRSKREM